MSPFISVSFCFFLVFCGLLSVIPLTRSYQFLLVVNRTCQEKNGLISEVLYHENDKRLIIVPLSQDTNSIAYKKAYNVIDACKLKYRKAIMNKHASLSVSFMSYIEVLEGYTTHFYELKQKAAKKKLACQMLDSLNI